MLTIESESARAAIWKCTYCIMQMSYLYASAFLSKTFANSLNMQNQQENIVWEKSIGNEAYPLSIRVQTTKLHFFASVSWILVIIIQQIVTLSKYGHDAPDICHP